MHSHSLDDWRHDHLFLGADHARNERRTRWVVALTAAMMLVEILGGLAFGSMALLADGLHMATHAGALGVAALAYRYARRHARDPRFAFGTGKLGDLAGFASALVLAVVSIGIGWESVVRLLNPVAIAYDEAIVIAVVGLAVNIASVWLLHDGGHHHGHDHGHGHHHDHGHHGHDRHGHHRDHNLRAAYFHVLADAVTSVGAILGLLAGRFYGWAWMDAVMGIVGGIMIARWSWGLLRDSGAVLLDTVPDPALAESIRGRLETGGDRIADLHLWRVGPGHAAAIVALVSDRPEPPAQYKARLGGLPGLSHVTVEVNRCDHAA
ncbi:CDF family Co(II)/Ni(II) efflux transporter DmeF [Mycobacterium sp. KBS0706]|uniref:CDF family Co(II)/Ni(II) efflux transporter DmeF n=1 Tax=Mycobacterium sp. KBS0706 TaxID=2578109 RepID=UPI00110FE542|nr:CDF family Co(II)/Ni(II) efflux transporter DmeF [Mycobacterium sp. KBS0706]TSD86558.1 CDF family Co(II)/Ni(II) efflux transporter DmeF [Mycobacterium sp. KBS0706]